MKLSLQAKVSLAIGLIILMISAVSTYLFTAAHSASKEKGRLLRGAALSYALSKAAEEGLLKEDLNLIKKASAIIQAPDVTLVQVYSDIWETIDAYPFEQLKKPPHPGALDHFRTEITQTHLPIAGGYDFYAPILFKAFEDAPPITIGYVRLVLSSRAIRQEIREIIIANVAISAAITFIAIISINILIGRLVVNPIMALHRSVSSFKGGVLTETDVPAFSAHELKDLVHEFNHMCKTIKDKENQLIESDRKIRSLFERVEHCIFRLDRYGTIIEANNRFRSLFGHVTGLCDILLGDRGAPDCLQKAAKNNVLHTESKAVSKNGDEVIIFFSLYPDKNEAGEITGFDGYIIDVTEKKRLEERLIRAQKMEAVGTLAGGMAHDFNNLLTAILGYSGIILKMAKEGDALYKPASIIHNAAKRGAEFGKKILTITRKEKMETKPVNINDVVRNSLELLSRSIPKNIEIVTHLRDDLPFTNADQAQMQQVIINLAVNARDAMPEGGKLVIETSVVGAEKGASGEDHLGSAGFIKLSVSDTGVGIDLGMQSKIFDPFFTTKDVGKGTGLGLYIVQSIISNHGGYINLYSEPSRGSRFNIYLPISTGQRPELQSIPADLKGSGTVLVIDDEADVRELCKDILSPLGYTVLLAESGAAGVALYREQKETISLIILDMLMPKMSGTETFNTLKAINPHARILLYSGYSHNNFAGIDQLLKRGALGFIQKPFASIELAVAVKKAVQPEAGNGESA